jgi:hypothetical protein
MRRFQCALLAAVAVIGFASVARATAGTIMTTPVVAGGTSGAAGAAATGGFIGFVGLLVTYDIIRRTTCSGDFLNLGGPGFTSPITPAMSILSPPICGHVPKARHRKH